MIKEVRIRNLVLIAQAEFSLEQGFNVLTGESGAGKSAVVAALSLALGARSDSQLLRKGEAHALVEMLFELQRGHAVFSKLEELGIPVQGEEIVIRREMRKEGKTRAFINDVSVQNSTLREVGELLVHFVGQHANQELLSLDNQRVYLDLYADGGALFALFKKKWQAFKLQEQRLNTLVADTLKRAREIEILEQQKEEIDAAAIEEGEEERLFESYKNLQEQQENAATLQEMAALFSQIQTLISQAQRLGCKLKGEESLLTGVGSLEKESAELHYVLARALTQLDADPYKLAAINERLSLIHRMNRKYTNALAYREKIAGELAQLVQIDNSLEELKKETFLLQEELEALARELSALRCKSGAEMALRLEQGLKELNMPKAEVEVRCTSQPRSAQGDDQVEFFIMPNAGEEKIALKNCASGGELSRFMLVLQALLAQKEDSKILIFDEIDANIGGKTADAVGKKLRELGEKGQVVCITHFAQVARHAHAHIQIEKREEEERTFTKLERLEGKQRKRELARMQGQEG